MQTTSSLFATISGLCNSSVDVTLEWIGPDSATDAATEKLLHSGMFFMVHGKWLSSIAQVCNTYLAQLLLRKSKVRVSTSRIRFDLSFSLYTTLINDENLAVAQPIFPFLNSRVDACILCQRTYTIS